VHFYERVCEKRHIMSQGVDSLLYIKERMKSMNTENTDMECSGCLYDLPLAYSYTPLQELDTVYEDDDALSRGTVFPELYKPVSVYGKEFAACAKDLGCLDE